VASAQAAQRYLRGNALVPREVTDLLQAIAEQGKRGGEIISHLRAMLRKEEATVETLSLNEVVNNLLRLVHSDLVTRNVSVVTDLEDDLPLVRGDAVQLQQLLLNLIVNGCDAMGGLPAGERILTIKTSTVSPGRVELSVADQGTGAPHVFLASMFEPFTTTKSNGMGLGLTVCRTIANAHAGRLEAAPNPDRGLRLSLVLPITEGGR
jgi:C4-dicarboxylate-specific signal transduction histidine kinase